MNTLEILDTGLNNQVDIDPTAVLAPGIKIVISGRNNHLVIGAETTFGGGLIEIRNHESSVVIGENCMLSGDITMDVSDMHSILDSQTGERLNPARDILIGDHVWLAQGVRIMKGAQIGQDCIIGSRSMVLGAIPANSLAVGSPAQVTRKGVTWDRRRLPMTAALNEQPPPDHPDGGGIMMP
jgi:acetyltransferase-like isoleucine patch superfamily enzyme